MDNDLVCAYLWQDIIRLGFSPSGTKHKKNWLRQYGKSLKLFWQIEDYPAIPSSRGGYLSATIDSTAHLGLCFEYAIAEQTNAKFTVRLAYSPPPPQRKNIDVDARC